MLLMISLKYSNPGWFWSREVTHFAGKAIRTQAIKIIDPVIALCPVSAWLAGTIIYVDGTETPFKACLALAGETVDTIEAGGTIGTGTHQAVVYINLTMCTDKSCQALAGEVASKAILILAQSTILAWKSEMRD